MRAAQVAPVVIEEQRRAVVQAAQSDGLLVAAEDLDPPPALIRHLAGECHIDHQVAAILLAARLGAVQLE
ncbi:MAG TPA: hypothetical protein VEC57_14545 [Candidatus Limnocylindrales bacterium]|nr:hypothetical protein [Candidatus Limnocylindrales bacterium]